MLHRIEDMKIPSRKIILPPGWVDAFPARNDPRDLAAGRYRAYLRHDDLKVLHSLDFVDGQWWDHVSVSRPSRLPSWEDLKTVKALFIGKEREAVQVLPKESEYVNMHPHCLHLWAKREAA
jgi:hypothetical protein